MSPPPFLARTSRIASLALLYSSKWGAGGKGGGSVGRSTFDSVYVPVGLIWSGWVALVLCCVTSTGEVG